MRHILSSDSWILNFKSSHRNRVLEINISRVNLQLTKLLFSGFPKIVLIQKSSCITIFSFFPASPLRVCQFKKFPRIWKAQYYRKMCPKRCSVVEAIAGSAGGGERRALTDWPCPGKARRQEAPANWQEQNKAGAAAVRQQLCCWCQGGSGCPAAETAVQKTKCILFPAPRQDSTSHISKLFPCKYFHIERIYFLCWRERKNGCLSTVVAKTCHSA